MLKNILFFVSLFSIHSLVAQNMWSEMSPGQVPALGERRIEPQVYRTFHLDLNALHPLLSAAPERFTTAAAEQITIFTIPMPDGSLSRFRLFESPVMAPALQAKYPEIRCYTGRGIDDPTALLKCDLTPKGFHAQVLSSRYSTVFIDPFQSDDQEHYVVYFKKDYLPKADDQPFSCGVQETSKELQIGQTPDYQGDCQLRRYRLALACTGEYAAFHGGTKPLVLAAMNTSMNRVNGVYENEFAVTMQIIANNDLLIYLNGATDPYSNDDGGAMLDENISTCNSVVGVNSYDIGHVFSTGGGGVAGLGVVCGGSKAWGVTGGGSPIGDAFDIDYVAHEMGHQFGGSHTQNNDCNRSGNASMEPGSASTIMGYAGICSPDVQPHSDDYFHAYSVQQIAAFITTGGNGCATKINIGNNNPTVNGGADRTIPKGTPFALTAVGADVNNDTLTYCWEQMDPEFATMPPVSTSATGPLFRSFLPTASPTRYFPRLSDLVTNTNFDWEELPGVARNMKFRVTVRDNNYNGGCTGEDNVVISVAGTAGPFVVTAPNTNVTWLVGATQTVTWDVANTNGAPINCANVRLLLSTDGGFTYPVVLLSTTPNTGSAAVTVPNNVSSTCRVKVESIGNIFFDISNQNFKIQTPPTPTFVLTAVPTDLQVCVGTNGVYTITAVPVAGFTSPVQLTVSGGPAGATVQINPNPVPVGGSATITLSGLTTLMAGNYTLTVQGSGGAVMQSIPLQLIVAPGAPTGIVSGMSPADGTAEVDLSPILTWNTVQYAQTYFVEVATSPSFSAASIVFSEATSNDSLFNVSLQPGTLYYWHIRPDNDCGLGSFSAVSAFETKRSFCNQVFTSVDVPKVIDPGSINTVLSNIQIPVSSIIGDVNVSVLIGHTWVGDLAATLTNPIGEIFSLFSQPGVPADDFGCSGDNIEAAFDDAATQLADDFENTCGDIPAISGSFQPIQPLSALNGQNVQGTWQLSVTDNFPEDGGELTAWSLSFCLNDTLATGALLTNSLLTLGASTTATVTNAYLKMKTSGLATQGQFILLALPQHGTLKLNGTALTLGSSFTQADLNAGTVTYQHNGDAGTTDQFTFDAFDTNNSAWVHQAVFHIIIVQNNLTANAVQTQAILCNNNTSGQITVTATGLDGQYQYSLNNGPLQSSNVFGNLSAGTYTVVVSGQYGFTVSSNAITFANPTALQISTVVDTNFLTITASGGTGALAYSIDGVNFQPENTFSDLPNGVYTVTVLDANGCSSTAQAIVAVNTLLASIEIQSQLLCNGGNQGSIIVNVGGGKPPYHFSLNNNVMSQTSNVFQNLLAGAYVVKVIDNQGFSVFTNTVQITAPPVISVSASATLNVVTVVASGGTGALEYSVNNIDFQSSNIFTDLINGNYTVTVHDANGCTATTEVEVNVAPLTGTAILASDVPCAGAQTASITATSSGGIAPYEYRLDNGPYQSSGSFAGLGAGIYMVTIRDAAGTELTVGPVVIGELDPVIPTVVVIGNDAIASFTGGSGGSFSYTLNGVANAPLTDLPNGEYILIATDLVAGCTGETTFTVNYIPLSATFVVYDIEPCDELINFIVTPLGGVSPFEYALDNSTYSTDSIFENVGAGMHTVHVRDAQGQIFNLPVEFTLPQVVTLTAQVAGDSIEATASHGLPPYEYSVDGSNFQSSSVFEHLQPGTYVVTVRDAAGCTASVENILILTDAVEPSLVGGVSVTPNPSAGLFQLHFQILQSAMQLEIMDVAGRRLKNWMLEPTFGPFSTPIDLQHFAEGTYILRLTDGKRSGAIRLQVIR